MSTTARENFHGIDVDALSALPIGSQVLLDAGVEGEVREHLPRGGRLRVDTGGTASLVVTYDAVERIL